MLKQPQVSFHGMDASAALTAEIHGKIADLERSAPALQSCRVVVDAPHRHQVHGRLYRVMIHAALPGRELVVDMPGEGKRSHEDPFVAVRDAFFALRRQLQEAMRERHARSA
jgi:ribosome-associated translation inhibitor RaiA